MPIVPCFDPATGASGGAPGGGGSTTPPTPPAATSEAVASGGSPSAKTFGAFTDPDGVIASYSATITNTVGSTSVSGSGLGPYSFSGSADGDSWVLELDALDSSARVVATAVHAVDVAAAGGGAGFTWSDVQEIDLSDGNVTAGSTSTPGAFTIYASDGTTPRVVGQFLRTVSATGTVSWDSSGVRIVVAGGAGAAYAIFQAPLSSIADLEESWHVDAVLEPLSSPSGSYMVSSLSKAPDPGTDDSIAWDLQNNSAKIEARRTVPGPSYQWGLTDVLGGTLPSTSNLRIECRGGRALFIGWDHSASAYFDDHWTGADSYGLGHAVAGVVGSTEMFGGVAYFSIGGTSGVDIRLQKWRYQELT